MISKKSTLLSAALSGFVFAGTAGAAHSEKNNSPAAAAPVAEAASGECHGINSCKGKGDCGGKHYSCAGNNSCRGKGWIKMTKKECTKKKGKFVAG